MSIAPIHQHSQTRREARSDDHARTSGRPPAPPISPALDKTFKIGLILKGLDGILEAAGGILLLFLSLHAIEHIARTLTAHELSQDPHDLIARYILHTASHLTGLDRTVRDGGPVLPDRQGIGTGRSPNPAQNSPRWRPLSSDATLCRCMLRIPAGNTAATAGWAGPGACSPAAARQVR